MIEFEQIKSYLSEQITNPVPAYIFEKDILKTPATNPNYINSYIEMKQSKWYCELANE